jgi:hypothetical protein
MNWAGYKGSSLGPIYGLSLHFPGEAVENTGNISHDTGSPGRDLNPGPSEYEAGVLI